MKTNMGTTDRIIRVLIAIAIGVLYSIGVLPGTLGIGLLALAGVLVLTSTIGSCPLYTLLGIDTCKR